MKSQELCKNLDAETKMCVKHTENEKDAIHIVILRERRDESATAAPWEW